ncbi:hypothetical protein Lser_V15G35368 [Lactuca serriola]
MHNSIHTILSVHKGKLSEKEAREYFQQLIDVVAYCHEKGVYHRDLKPGNLLLDIEGKLKVSDFGLSALPQQVRQQILMEGLRTSGIPFG